MAVKVDKRAKLEKVASKDGHRPVLTALNLRVVGEGAGVLEATDAYTAARVPVTVDADDTEGMVPVEALTEARKAAGRHEEATLAASNGDVRVDGTAGTVTMPRPKGQYPDFEKIWPDIQAGAFQFGINAKLLVELAQGLGSTDGHVTLTFQGPQDEPDVMRAILVTAHHGVQGAEGIIMPVKIAG